MNAKIVLDVSRESPESRFFMLETDRDQFFHFDGQKSHLYTDGKMVKTELMGCDLDMFRVGEDWFFYKRGYEPIKCVVRDVISWYGASFEDDVVIFVVRDETQLSHGFRICFTGESRGVNIDKNPSFVKVYNTRCKMDPVFLHFYNRKYFSITPLIIHAVSPVPVNNVTGIIEFDLAVFERTATIAYAEW